MRPPKRQTQLDWKDPAAMRWEDLPASVRDQVRASLGVLLRHGAGPAAPGEEAGHEA